jgi:ATP-dependent Lhr-like helicase
VPLWQQRKRAVELLAVAARYDAFPIVLETYRECLRDVFDMPALVGLLRDIEARQVRVVTVDSRAPSPFAAALLFGYVGNFLYEGDAPLAERRAQALTVDPAQLRSLLGDLELRDLLDAGAIGDVERALQRLGPERAASSADAVHDLLLHLGDLADAEVARRAAPAEAAPGWIEGLLAARRIAAVPVAGERRLVAAEDLARYRDALGIAPPPGAPRELLEPVRDPLGDLVSRYARTHGPFSARDAAARLGIGVAPVTAALERLAGSGRVVEGEFRPGRSGREWCDAGVLRAVRQRSLARLRREVEPVDAPALARLAADWQGIGSSRRGRHALLEVIAQLQGATVPASALETEILPARLARYDPAELDALMAAGVVVWVGAGALGPRDGRMRLYLAEHAPLLLDAPPDAPEGPLHRRVLDHLAARGASFFPQILQGTASGGTPGFVPDLVAALWDLVWAGLVTNDTLQPLRALLGPRPRRDRRAARRAPGQRLVAPGVPVGAGAGWPSETAGRWSLVSGLGAGPGGPAAAAPSAAQAMTARARQLLERHGVLTREGALAEGLAGGFGAVYPALRAMEEAGRIRRGYFVAGQGATQFALPGAVERLRALREPGEEPRGVRLAATDPANPYGAALPWPEREGGRRPMRAAGALVVLVDGALAAWMGPRERQLVTFLDAAPGRQPGEVARVVARLLAREPEVAGRPVVVAEVDGRPTAETPMAGPLAEAGFLATPHGYLRRAG